jgi:hypothetical protein
LAVQFVGAIVDWFPPAMVVMRTAFTLTRLVALVAWSGTDTYVNPNVLIGVKSKQALPNWAEKSRSDARRAFQAVLG